LNEFFDTGIFPDTQKLANITPVFKKGNPFLKENYRPISILPLLSKILERVLHTQISDYMDAYLNPILCGFRKKHNTQHALLKLLNSWQKYLDNSGFVVTVLMDLSKAYDCLPHDLIIAKLQAYGFDKKSLRLLYSYLQNRKQRVKIGNQYSDWIDILIGVPQGSILGPLFFNIFINDLFLFIEKTEICNFADDNTIYSCGHDLSLLVNHIIHDMKIVLKWFTINSLKANPDKFQFMVLGTKRILYSK
jgi:hypothetical protein